VEAMQSDQAYARTQYPMLCSVLCPDRLHSLVQFPLALRLAEFILPLLHLLAPPGVITNDALIHGLP
jgi:hypothetical protein